MWYPSSDRQGLRTDGGAQGDGKREPGPLRGASTHRQRGENEWLGVQYLGFSQPANPGSDPSQRP